ncbi:hypothetical protein MHU86_22405 [Fragilaria crotonensis]|nr:hypothetical protein MHU86_22405 [Fragilaria crotonensis]
MLSGFDNGNTTDCAACFDRDDGNGAFSPNSSTNQAQRTKGNDDSDEDEDEAIDWMAKNVMDFILLRDKGDNRRGQGDNVPPPTKKRRQPKKQRAIWVDDDGSVRRISPRQTVWYSVYILKPDLEDPKFHKLFC